MISVLYIITAFIFPTFLGEKKTSCNKYGLTVSTQTKGIAAILIVVGHCVIAGNGPEFLAFFNVGWYIVAFFFFWSGFGVMYGYENKPHYLKGFLLDRALKVFIPFLMVHPFYVAVKLFGGVQFTLLDILKSFLGLRTIVDNSWYPVAAYIFYLLFFVVFSLRRCSLIWKIYLAFGGVVLISVLEALFLDGNWWVVSNLSFFIGLVFCRIRERINPWILIIGCIITYFVGFLLLPVNARLFNNSVALYEISCNIISASVTLFIIYLFNKLARRNKALTFLGEISYEIYLIHGLFIYLFSDVWGLNIYILLILAIACSIVAAWPLHKLNIAIICSLKNTKKIKQIQ